MEAAIVERLNELRQWQIEQQARLLQQQQEQREMLTVQQDRMYRALELSVQSIHDNSNISETSQSNRHVNNDMCSLVETLKVSSITESIQEISRSKNIVKSSNLSCSDSNKNNKCYNESICKEQSFTSTPMKSTLLKAEVTDRSKKCSDENNTNVYLAYKNKFSELDCLMEGVAPLGLQKPSENIISIDDIPVPSPKKDFHTLLEERLQSCTASPKANTIENPKNNVKKPFLRKGQGLARFRMKKSSGKISQTKSGSTILSPSTQLGTSGNNTKKNEKTSQNATIKKNTPLPIEKTHLNLKNGPPPKKKGQNKPMAMLPALQEVKNFADLSSSDLETKTQRELEEVRIFELLEEKAENSSFCSTSSTVLAFLQQSTPSKSSRLLSGQVASKVNSLKQRSHTNNKIDELSYKQVGKNTSKTVETRSLTVPSQLEPRHFPAQITDAYWETLTHIATTRENLQFLHSNPRSVSMERNISNFETSNSSTDSLKHEHDERPSELYNSAEQNEADVSLHVRFSEYNEYKTIGLTDTSSISSESSKSYADERAWSDSSPIYDSYDVEPLPLKANSIISSSTRTDDNQSVVQDYNLPEYKFDNKVKMQAANENDKGDLIGEAWTCNPRTNVEASEASEAAVDSIYTDETSEDDEGHNQKAKCDSDLDDTIFNEIDKKNNTPNQVFDDNNCTDDDTIFKSDLLKTRLLELEREIDIFRKENATLSSERQKLLAEREKMYKEFREKKEEWEKDIQRTELRLSEEKKKLARDKAALEVRIRDSQEKNQLQKLERQEVQKLKQQIEELKEEMKEKENRWAAAHSRQKSQLRILKVENTKLKQEIEQMENARRNNQRMKASSYSNTKAINRINKHLDGYTQVAKKERSSDEEEDKSVKPITNAPKNDIASTTDDVHENTTNDNATDEQSTNRIANKRNLYEHLLKEAITGLIEAEDLTKSTNSPNKQNNSRTDGPKKVSLTERVEPKTNDVKKTLSQHDNSVSASSPDTKCQSSKEDVKVIEHANGHVEYWYPNGNVKKVFPEQNLTKMLYYNGDVCETQKDGKVKYFYASTRTWHTTMPDGLEILEFPDGQIERRSRNGNIEVSFPDGSLRMVQSDGVEKWVLPDGVVAETFPNGEKVLNFPNGQREIHTRTHKQREYPDGTVKLVYPDGTQETRYSNGRVRLKNKDGVLIMDSNP